MPTIDQTMPTTVQTMPTIDQTMPIIDQTMPTIDQTMPIIDQTMPTIDQTMSTLTPLVYISHILRKKCYTLSDADNRSNNTDNLTPFFLWYAVLLEKVVQSRPFPTTGIIDKSGGGGGEIGIIDKSLIISLRNEKRKKLVILYIMIIIYIIYIYNLIIYIIYIYNLIIYIIYIYNLIIYITYIYNLIIYIIYIYTLELNKLRRVWTFEINQDIYKKNWSLYPPPPTPPY